MCRIEPCNAHWGHFTPFKFKVRRAPLGAAPLGQQPIRIESLFQSTESSLMDGIGNVGSLRLALDPGWGFSED